MLYLLKVLVRHMLYLLSVLVRTCIIYCVGWLIALSTPLPPPRLLLLADQVI